MRVYLTKLSLLLLKASGKSSCSLLSVQLCYQPSWFYFPLYTHASLHYCLSRDFTCHLRIQTSLSLNQPHTHIHAHTLTRLHAHTLTRSHAHTRAPGFSLLSLNGEFTCIILFIQLLIWSVTGWKQVEIPVPDVLVCDLRSETCDGCYKLGWNQRGRS